AWRGSHELHTVGVGGLVEELLSALDSTLQRSKLVVAAVVGLLAGLAVVFVPWLSVGDEFPLTLVPWAALGAVVLLLVGVGSALLTQITFVELSRLRPARRAEATQNLWRHALTLIACYLLVAGGIVVLIAGLRELPAWLLDSEAEGMFGARELAGVAVALALILEVILWPLLGLALLLGPIVVIDEGGVGASLARWCRLLREHPSRVIVYQALAAALGAVVVLPLVFPVVFAGGVS